MFYVSTYRKIQKIYSNNVIKIKRCKSMTNFQIQIRRKFVL